MLDAHRPAQIFWPKRQFDRPSGRAPMIGRVRHARLSGDKLQQHMLMVYDPADRLVCWCGPYKWNEALDHLRKWVAAGWSGPRHALAQVR